MAGVAVTFREGGEYWHADAVSWYVDDYGYLYVRGPQGHGNIAAYAKDAWLSVIAKG